MSFIWRRISEVGGIRNAFRMMLKMKDVRAGTVIGEDKFGNQYFQNNDYFFGRHRWVFYARKDFDASQVPSEWHRWLHSMTDTPPTVEPPIPRKFFSDHTENFSASKKEYVPYSTVQPKIHSWQPINK